MYEDFLYTSRNANLPREGCLTAQDENVYEKGMGSLDQSGHPLQLGCGVNITYSVCYKAMVAAVGWLLERKSVFF